MKSELLPNVLKIMNNFTIFPFSWKNFKNKNIQTPSVNSHYMKLFFWLSIYKIRFLFCCPTSWFLFRRAKKKIMKKFTINLLLIFFIIFLTLTPSLTFNHRSKRFLTFVRRKTSVLKVCNWLFSSKLNDKY